MAYQPSLTRRTKIILYPGLVVPIDSIVGLVDVRDTIVIVDSGTGLPGSIAAMARGLAEAGWPARRVGYVVNTHGHATNSGGDWWLHGQAGAVVVARDPDAQWIEAGDQVMTGASQLGFRFRPAIVGLRPRRDPYLLVEGGGVRVELHHTPGHTPGSQSVLVEDGEARILFVGDALGRLSPGWLSSEQDWWRSLERIRGLEPDILCTSVTCMQGIDVGRFIEEVEKAGPEWV